MSVQIVLSLSKPIPYVRCRVCRCLQAMHSVMYNIHKVQHIQALWFANCCNSNLWWVYSKAIYRALMSACGGSGIKFKTTVKVMAFPSILLSYGTSVMYTEFKGYL